MAVFFGGGFFGIVWNCFETNSDCLTNISETVGQVWKTTIKTRIPRDNFKNPEHHVFYVLQNIQTNQKIIEKSNSVEQ